MKILTVIPVYDYGSRERGFSTEYTSLFECLKSMPIEVTAYDYLTRYQEIGKAAMNRELVETVQRAKPDLVLFSLYTDQFEPETLQAVKRLTTTVYYAYDDMWRTQFVDQWAPHFTYVTTSYVNGVREMQSRGHRNGIYLSFGCNHFLYVKKNLPKTFDASFVGMWHPHRAWLIGRLKKAGVSVHVWGAGWNTGKWGRKRFSAGRLTLEQAIDVMNQTKVNLNLSNESSWDVRYLSSSPWAVWNTLRSGKRFAPVNLRVFEINCCGGFQLMPYMEGVERRYEIGNELVVFQDPDQLVERVRYYVSHDDERERIAALGHARSLRDHTMEQRFQELFEKVGLSQRPGAGVRIVAKEA